jgi:hypothetical protein
LVPVTHRSSLPASRPHSSCASDIIRKSPRRSEGSVLL